ncbi:class I SAM-dependent methyltransferase [Maridesulfovibrio sp.]|jgi:predicted methyltransferase|uniref:tRNA (mnm(5)s(2)U34)-methyltransferase n=1 Tax=Maridesulfovibrio sp. TaxID=2795000 RepID=UPI0029CA692F|nr:class I SAM-dependent methyltransferase [Maridesulfovibrio sp.]
MISNNILSFAKSVLCELLEPGCIAIDATVGNGYDTVFLSETAGADGHVFGFDIQEEAVKQTEQRLNEECRPQNWTIFHSGHENMLELIPAEFHGRIDVVMFNLGFLPGSDKTVITKSATTLVAIEASLGLLTRGGLLCVAIYAGHPGGDEEDRAVREYCTALDYHAYRVIQSEMINKPGYPIRMLFVTKL